MSTFDCDAATLWYESLGHGDLLIALHGGLGLDHTYFRPWLDPLGEQVEVAYLDLRANGRSTGDGDDLTMPRLAEDVDALRRHLGHERTWLLGHSYGGFVALEYALTFPAHTLGLVLVDTDSARPAPETMVAGLQRLGVAPDELAVFETPVETTEDMFALFDTVEPWYLPHSAPGTARTVLGDTLYRPGGAAGGDRALEGWDVTARLPEVAAPTLVISGVDDFMFRPDGTRRLADALPRGTAVIIDDSGHLPFVDQTDATLSAIRGFLHQQL